MQIRKRKITIFDHTLKDDNNSSHMNSLSNSRQHSANADVMAGMKSKIIVSRRHFLPTRIFLPLEKFKTIKIKSEKNPLSKQIRTYYILQGILKIFSNTYALPFLFSKL